MRADTSKRKMPEIVSPAGNIEKLKFAVNYGADAVYFGGTDFNLRMRADNLNDDDIIDGISYCKKRGVKTVFLLNSFLHEKDIPGAKRYIGKIRDYDFDAIMISDPGMMILLRETEIHAKIHLSTQMSVLNHLTVKFWKETGIDRIVLARETTLDEIAMIRENTGAEIEVFVHGALCISYSGRCLLSRYLSGRDANSGDCAHPCRWNFSLVETKRPGDYFDVIEHERGTEILSSKDLCLIEKIPAYVRAGVDAFKIEGRMKSVYYTANATRIYRHAVSLSGTEDFDRFLPFWKNELDLISHRPYTDDLFNEFGKTGFAPIPYINRTMFLGYKISDAGENEIMVKTFNPVCQGDEVEAIFPIENSVRDNKFIVIEIFDMDKNSVAMARPNEIYLMKFDRFVGDDAIFRKKID